MKSSSAGSYISTPESKKANCSVNCSGTCKFPEMVKALPVTQGQQPNWIHPHKDSLCQNNIGEITKPAPLQMSLVQQYGDKESGGMVAWVRVEQNYNGTHRHNRS